MQDNHKEQSNIKVGLHPRNRHRYRYDFSQLIAVCHELAPFVHLNKYNAKSIDFFNPHAVKMLNKALLKYHYGINYWEIPPQYLCPPVPGRADYIHYMADVLATYNHGKIPTGPEVKCLDIGVGASCIYPIVGTIEYGWSFIGSDIDPLSIQSGIKIIESNPTLHRKITLRIQPNPKAVFQGIIRKNERFDLSFCNPPFHSSPSEATAGTIRKVKNLSRKKIKTPILNFGGQNAELWCAGGEKRFVRDMIVQSKHFSTSCGWFSTLISKQSNLKSMVEFLKTTNPAKILTIPMNQGNKSSRILAWTFQPL